MSSMSDLDIVLSEYKLSDPQKNAVLEVIASGEFETAKPNTIKSLEKNGIIAQQADKWVLSLEVARKVQPILERNKEVFEAFNEVPSPSEKAEWQGAPSANPCDDVSLVGKGLAYRDEVQAVQEIMFGVEDKDEPYAQWELDLLGFGAWRKTDGAWDGLSIKEIKEDIKTAFNTNRAARRRHTKILTSEYRKVFCPRPRKALKITGKVGV